MRLWNVIIVSEAFSRAYSLETDICEFTDLDHFILLSTFRWHHNSVASDRHIVLRLRSQYIKASLQKYFMGATAKMKPAMLPAMLPAGHRDNAQETNFICDFCRNE